MPSPTFVNASVNVGTNEAIGGELDGCELVTLEFKPEQIERALIAQGVLQAGTALNRELPLSLSWDCQSAIALAKMILRSTQQAKKGR